ncbi:MAG TPA: hypothetical protein O0X23_03335, partial [Methanocorpusculum sp.]|nr:hypothetical protein [Methanocorpusculum sp.]
ESKRKALVRMFVVPFFITAIGMIMYGVVICFLSLSSDKKFPFSVNDGTLLMFAGLVVAFMGIYLRPLVQRYIFNWIELMRWQDTEVAEESHTPVYKKIKY